MITSRNPQSNLGSMEIKNNMEIKMKIEVNNIRRKSLHWWRALSQEMKMTMVHNPDVNKTDVTNVRIIGRSSIQVQRMFKNWLSWEIQSQGGE